LGLFLLHFLNLHHHHPLGLKAVSKKKMELLDTYHLFWCIAAAASTFSPSFASSAASLSPTQDSLYLDEEYVRNYHYK